MMFLRAIKVTPLTLPLRCSSINLTQLPLSRSFKPTTSNIRSFSIKNRSKILNIINKRSSFELKDLSTPSQSHKAVPLSESWNLKISDTDAYTSSHFRLRPGEVEQMLNSLRMEYKISGDQVKVKFCPLCPKDHKHDPTNMFTCNIQRHIGVFHCFRCGSKGSWFDFKRLVTGNISVENYNSGTIALSSAYSNYHQDPNFDPDYALNAYQELFNTNNNSIDYLTRKNNGGRGLSEETLQFYRVGCKQEKFRQLDGTYDYEECMVFPIYAKRSTPRARNSVPNKRYDEESLPNAENIINHNPEYQCIKLKLRALSNKSKQRFNPAGISATGLFGLNTVPAEAKAIVITEGEFDAMAVHQATGMPAVSLPNGAHSLPPVILPWLEKYEKIYLWLDNDEAGQSAVEKFSQKLGKGRTLIVKAPMNGDQSFKDANETLIGEGDLMSCIRKAKSLNEENIIGIRDMTEDIISRLFYFEEMKGTQSGYFKWYNNILKGFRKGELTIFTGPTGSGKTTFLSQLSLDFLERGIPTLWGSFEVKNEILASTMIQQYSKNDTAKMTKNDLKDIIEEMGDLPLYFMKFFGSTDLDVLFNTLDYAVYTYDIGHIVLDNLQFMISGQGRGASKFDIQDGVISGLRRFATEKNVHITIVIHPKKVDDDDELTIASVFGSAKATQESDNIMIMQNKHRFRYIDIRKNRFDGSIGRVPIGFDRSTKRYFELSRKEEESFYRENVTMKDIISVRLAEFGTTEPYLLDDTRNATPVQTNDYVDRKERMPKMIKEPEVARQAKTEQEIQKAREFKALDKQKMNQILASDIASSKPIEEDKQQKESRVKEFEKIKKKLQSNPAVPDLSIDNEYNKLASLEDEFDLDLEIPDTISSHHAHNEYIGSDDEKLYPKSTKMSDPSNLYNSDYEILTEVSDFSDWPDDS
ncbi:unnamed protein product [Moneuplotes crassus]|uniref:SF4 helicase domain-containing protein n=2 Tax=Euplotes crassus TaxID=5936 RepID=A0AAD2D7R0_EUPCR|nr:unnamed protein product [Moneuplotes crassus]